MKYNKVTKSKYKKSDISIKRSRFKFFYKLKLTLKILLCLFVVAFLFSPIFDDLKNSWKNNFYAYSAESGLVLRKVIIEGNKNVSDQEIINIINSKKNTPILQLDLLNIKLKLEENAWVQRAMVERQLPSTLYIALLEREAVAIWQFQNKLYLIDDSGMRIVPYSSRFNNGFIQVVGQDANIYARGLIEELKQCPELENEIVSAVRFGNRRWNLHFNNGLIVKMPENNFADSYQYICKLHSSKKLFNPKMKMIDLRNRGKIYIK